MQWYTIMPERLSVWAQVSANLEHRSQHVTGPHSGAANSQAQASGEPGAAQKHHGQPAPCLHCAWQSPLIRTLGQNHGALGAGH